MEKLSSFDIESITSLVSGVLLDQVKVPFKNECDLSPTGDDTFSPGVKCEPWDLIHDETHNEIYEVLLQVTDTNSERDKVIKSLIEKIGEPTEKERTQGNVWKFGRKKKGQLWIYPSKDGTFSIDIRYYYDKK